MRKLEGEQTRMRLFLGEAEKWHGKPLYHALLELFRREHLAGATVLRGISGFGASSHLHTAQVLRLSQDMPVVIEVVDTREHIERVLPKVDEIMEHGLVTLEPVHVIRYAARKPKS